MAFSPPSSYAVNDEGGTFIAASQRPDGTWRKPRRVKDGYVPQDEVPLYESKGRQFTKHVPQYPVGLDPALIKAAEARKEKAARISQSKISPIPGLVLDVNDTKSKKKKQKSAATTEEVTDSLLKIKVSQKDTPQKVKNCVKNSTQKTKGNQKEASSKTPQTSKTPVKEPESTPADPAKRIKNLRKRLREIEAIEQKIASGELKSLEKDQLDKVARKNEILTEINDIESITVSQSLTSV